MIVANITIFTYYCHIFTYIMSYFLSYFLHIQYIFYHIFKYTIFFVIFFTYHGYYCHIFYIYYVIFFTDIYIMSFGGGGVGIDCFRKNIFFQDFSRHIYSSNLTRCLSRALWFKLLLVLIF